MTRLLVATLIAGMSACTPVLAQTSDTCNGSPKFTNEEAVEALSTEYGESPIAFFLESQQSETHVPGVITIWVNEETGTWSVTLTDPNSMTCLVTYGDDFSLSIVFDAPQGTLH